VLILTRVHPSNVGNTHERRLRFSQSCIANANGERWLFTEYEQLALVERCYFLKSISNVTW
jgi:hypothetical protein